jgi:spore coat protein U-like protein
MKNIRNNHAMMKYMRAPVLAPILILALLLPLPAIAACPQCTCAVSATGVSFGRYSPLSPRSTDDTGTIRISCGGGVGSVAYSIQLSQGIYGTAFRPRRMANGNSRLAYNLYTNAAHTTIWGDGSNGTVVVSDTLNVAGAGATREHIVYGRVPGNQTSAAVGHYDDTIMFTIIYQ